MALLVAAGILVSGYIIFTYASLHQKASRARALSDAIASQENALGEQQQQISELAGRINTMRSQLFSLHEFEKKIRVIADIKGQPDNINLSGMGGVSPGDIGARAPNDESRNDLLREMHHQLRMLDSAAQAQEENFSSLLGCLEDKRQMLASTPAIWPVNGGWVTSRFENRRSPFTGQLEFHQGLDIAAGTGTPVMASADGEVIFSGVQGALGNLIVIDHGRGVMTRYGHLHECAKKQGDRVKREEVLGAVGNSGQSTGPHLHYEVRVNSMPVNPDAYILN